MLTVVGFVMLVLIELIDTGTAIGVTFVLVEMFDTGTAICVTVVGANNVELTMLGTLTVLIVSPVGSRLITLVA